MRIFLLCTAALSLAACQQDDAPVVNQGDLADETVIDTQEDEAAAPAELDLAGDWSIVSLNGYPNATADPVTVRFEDDRMLLTSACLDYAYALNRDRNIVSPERVQSGSCARGLSPVEEMIDKAMPNFNILMDRGEELHFSGPGGSLKLSRQGD